MWPDYFYGILRKCFVKIISFTRKALHNWNWANHVDEKELKYTTDVILSRIRYGNISRLEGIVQCHKYILWCKFHLRMMGILFFEFWIQIYTSKDRNTQLLRTQESQKYINSCLHYSKITFSSSSLKYIHDYWVSLAKMKKQILSWAVNINVIQHILKLRVLYPLVCSSVYFHYVQKDMSLNGNWIKGNNINKNSAPQIQW